MNLCHGRFQNQQKLEQPIYLEPMVPVCTEVRELRDKVAATVSFLSLLRLFAERRVHCRLSGFNCGALPCHQPEFLLTDIECAATVCEREREREIREK